MFTSENIKQLQRDVAKALKKVEKEHSVAFDLTFPRSYETYKLNFKVEVTRPSPYRDNYLKQAAQFGLDLSWLDKQFFHRGDYYQVIGLDPARVGKPVACSKLRTGTDTPGATHSFQVEFIKAQKFIPITTAA
jgi:hypothetical protein